MISDILLRLCAVAVGLFMAFMTFYSIVVSSNTKAAASGFGFTVLMAATAVAAHRRLKRLKENRRLFLLRFEGRSIADARLMARAEAVALAPGLVADKVNIPFEHWSAYEITGFQFVLASDEQGRARAFPISS
jgi:hypothetical protein